jgi:hypothetical protein
MLVVICILPSAPVGATVVVAADLAELAREARAILRGRVIAIEPRWTADRRTIETLVTLHAEASLKGRLGPTVQVLVPGGRLGRYRTVLVGAPEFAVDQRIVLFLSWRAPSYPYVLGLGQGVFRVAPGEDGALMVTPPPLLAPQAGSLRVVRGDPRRRPMPLVEFEAQVRALAKAQR